MGIVAVAYLSVLVFATPLVLARKDAASRRRLQQMPADIAKMQRVQEIAYNAGDSVWILGDGVPNNVSPPPPPASSAFRARITPATATVGLMIAGFAAGFLALALLLWIKAGINWTFDWKDFLQGRHPRAVVPRGPSEQELEGGQLRDAVPRDVPPDQEREGGQERAGDEGGPSGAGGGRNGAAGAGSLQLVAAGGGAAQPDTQANSTRGAGSVPLVEGAAPAVPTTPTGAAVLRPPSRSAFGTFPVREVSRPGTSTLREVTVRPAGSGTLAPAAT